MARKYIQLHEVNRTVFSLIYERGYALREQLTLAVRGRRVANDRYLHRVLRKMETLGVVSAHRQTALGKKIYCVTRRNVEGRRLALARFGEDRRTVPARPQAQIDHALFLTWIYVYFHLACQHLGYAYDYFDRHDLAERGWSLRPDAVLVIQKPPGRRAFCVEYQRQRSAERTTLEKLDAYRREADALRLDLGAERIWVLFILAKPARWLADFVRALPPSDAALFATPERFLETAPQSLWTAPIWWAPGESERVPIFLPRA